MVQRFPWGAEEAAGGRRPRRRERATWGRLRPPLRWTPPLSGWTLNGTVGRRRRGRRLLDVQNNL